ncbi:MAG: BamA/TamA family outer membrane protein [Bacteroidales bacterium]|jgi:outer membrane protein insertion porin family|nr:BamA/TamA family outer membrane protein [Bacteroidales bacterium]
MQKIKAILIIILVGFGYCRVHAQVVLQGGNTIKMDYMNPQTYEIGGITFSGTVECDLRTLGLKVGDKIQIPGEQLRKAIDRLSALGIFTDNVQISASKIVGNTLFLDIYLEEAPRLKSFIYKGVKKADIDDFEKKINLSRGKVINENVKTVVANVIENFYRDKGFYNAKVNITEIKDTLNPRFITLNINVEKGKRVRVNGINVLGNQQVDATKLRSAMKETKTRFLFQPLEKWDTAASNFIKHYDKYKDKDFGQLMLAYFSDRVRVRFKKSKYDPIQFETDKDALLKKYNELGFRDAYIVDDSVYMLDDNSLQIDIHVDEGQKYYFRNISWVGNTKYDSELLGRILQINKGDVYNTALLEKNLNMSQDNIDVSSLYLDDGYLFFYAVPVETAIVGDSVDIEIRIREGSQAKISKVSISGNTRTGDEVILRELATLPGRKFSRSDIIRSQRQLLQLGFFNQEKLNVIPKPNEQTGTVDLEYVVEEAPSDQLNLSLGWGSGMFYGSVGITFNNFAMRKFFKKEAWAPVPSGDGQKLSLGIQIYTSGYQQYSLSFTEPWLGGKKPLALSVGGSFALVNSTSGTTKSKLNITTVSVGLSNRLKLPDDYFYMSNTILYQRYQVENYGYFVLDSGVAHGISYLFSLGRNSTDAMIYPRTGSEFSLSVQLTPPYSLFNGKNYSDMPDYERYKFLEYHKWKFNVSQFVNIYENLVLNVRAKFGYLGMYNRKVGLSPFERFYLGGSGLTSTSILDSRDIISMRGYSDQSIGPYDGGSDAVGGSVFQKLTFELRYPVTLNPSATVYLLSFLEAGNCWGDIKDYRPFDMYRAAGVGIRVYLPMFGLLGLDWGYGFDDIPGQEGKNKSQFHFSIGQSIE